MIKKALHQVTANAAHRPPIWYNTLQKPLQKAERIKGHAMNKMENMSTISQDEFEFSQEVIRKLGQYYSTRVVGQEGLKKSLITSLVADGHILIESVPGLAKTTAAKAISDAVSGKFSRIQCTPDLLPSDIIGTQIYHQETGKFETIFGPVFANFVLLDEVNRSSAKTQSAMLEAMQERQVTIGGVTYRMPQDIFIVIATQNPIEQEGTYPLSEAQTDRFMIKEKITYPSAEEEITIMNKIEDGSIASKEPAVLSLEEVDKVQDVAEKVYIDASVKKYIADIVTATRHPADYIDKKFADYIRIGASPRATINFLKVAKASALMNGRTFVIPEDVKNMRHQVLRHRIGLGYAAVADNVPVETIVDLLVNSVPTP